MAIYHHFSDRHNGAVKSATMQSTRAMLAQVAAIVTQRPCGCTHAGLVESVVNLKSHI